VKLLLSTATTKIVKVNLLCLTHQTWRYIEFHLFELSGLENLKITVAMSFISVFDLTTSGLKLS
jgi:hypothetical protein